MKYAVEVPVDWSGVLRVRVRDAKNETDAIRQVDALILNNLQDVYNFFEDQFLPSTLNLDLPRYVCDEAGSDSSHLSESYDFEC
jgi:hypothetical protein